MGRIIKARARLTAVAVNTARANQGLINDIIDHTIDQWIEGADFSACLDGAQSQIADAALQRHGEKVVAGLARAGLTVPLEALSVDGISQAIKEKMGLDFGDFSPESVLDAVDHMIASRLSEVSGVEITSVRGDDLQTVIKAAVRASLRSGNATKLVSYLLNYQARKLVTLEKLGSNKVELRKLQNRQSQANYRKTHKLVWQ